MTMGSKCGSVWEAGVTAGAAKTSVGWSCVGLLEFIFNTRQPGPDYTDLCFALCVLDGCVNTMVRGSTKGPPDSLLRDNRFQVNIRAR